MDQNRIPRNQFGPVKLLGLAHGFLNRNLWAEIRLAEKSMLELRPVFQIFNLASSKNFVIQNLPINDQKLTARLVNPLWLLPNFHQKLPLHQFNKFIYIRLDPYS